VVNKRLRTTDLEKDNSKSSLEIKGIAYKGNENTEKIIVQLVLKSQVQKSVQHAG